MHYSTHLFRHTRTLIGDAIRRHRLRRRWTLEQLAERSGLSMPLLDRYEMGRGEVELNALLRIACAKDVEMGELIRK